MLTCSSHVFTNPAFTNIPTIFTKLSFVFLQGKNKVLTQIKNIKKCCYNCLLILRKTTLCSPLKFSFSSWKTHPKYFVYLLFECLFQIKVMNQYRYTPKNANITRYIKKKKTLCNTLNWRNWNSGFVKLGVRWAERDTWLNFTTNHPQQQ